LISALVLTSCASIPVAGPVEIIENVNVQSDLDDVRVIAKLPSRKMTGLQIVSGFISANISTVNDYAIAREYLTSESSETWKPNSVVVLDSASIRYSDSGAGFINVTGLQTGVLTPSHRYNIFETPEPINIKFNLVSRSDGLRIQGILQNGFLTTSDLIRGYSPYSLYYANENYSSLVPEVVWLPHYEKSVGTKLINILMAGSKLGLKTAIPVGTKLQNGLVVIERGIGEVNLTSSALQSDNTQRQFMMAQIVWTLQSISTVGRVGIFANGETLGADGKTILVKEDFQELSPDYQTEKSNLYLVKNSRIKRLKNGEKVLVGFIGNANQISVTSDQLRISYLIGDSLKTAFFSLPIEAETTHRGVRSFVYDRFKRVWFVENSGDLTCEFQDGSYQSIVLPLNLQLSKISISRDGGRIAMVAETKTGSKLYVATINSENGTLSVGKPRTFEQSFSEVFDVDWFNSEELVVIGRIGLSKPQVQTVSLTTGYIKNLAAPSSVEELESGGKSSVAVRRKNGQVWLFKINTWTKIGESSAIAFSR
ncbi:MAG: hypothetical protein RLZZ330_186, partial [Actinomycetota bacterium]|jgi:hypothetical protein